MDAAELSEALSSGELYLSARQLPEVPQSVFTCCGLLLLDLSVNSLVSLPVALSELKSLTYLDVSFNQLHELPACLGALAALTCLKASYNQIERLHPQALVGLGGCLQELHLGDNALTSGGLPSQLSCLTRLTHLDLRYNHNLTAVPPELGYLAPPVYSSGTGIAQKTGTGPTSTVSAFTAVKQQSQGTGGSLTYLSLEGCPLGEVCLVEASSRSGTAAGGGSGPGPGPGGLPKNQRQQHQHQQTLYRRLQATAAAAVTAAETGGVTAEAAAQKALAEALRQLLQHLPRERHPAASSSNSSSWSGSTVPEPEQGVTATASREAAGRDGPRAAGFSGNSDGRVDLLVLTPNPAQASGCAAATHSAGGPGALADAAAGAGRPPGAGLCTPSSSGLTRGTGLGPPAPSGRTNAMKHLQPLQLHDGPGVRGGGSGSCGPYGRPPGLQHGGPHRGGAIVLETDIPGGPRSPLTDLRNSHADLELVDGDEDEGDPGAQGINIVGPGAATTVVHSLSPQAGGELAQSESVAAALAIALEELSELPPAAAAAMYRSLDVVAVGVQEMREGRPLSRGGTSHASSASASAVSGGSGAPPLFRPATSASRPGSHQQRRPGSSSLRPGSSAGSSFSQDLLRPRASSSQSNRPGSSAGPGPGISSSGQRQQPLTGAMALLAAAGMGPAAATWQGGGGGGRPIGATGTGATAVATGGGVDASCGLGSLAPITFPLASGVRGMLRGMGAASMGAKPVCQGPAISGATNIAASTQSGGPGAAATWLGRREGANGIGPSMGDSGDATVNGEEDVMLAAELDRLAMVRRLLADRNPELVKALDEQVFEEGEEGSN